MNAVVTPSTLRTRQASRGRGSPVPARGARRKRGAGAPPESRFSIWSLPSRLVCLLACFPYGYFSRLKNWSDRSQVVMRGFAVVLSPTVGLMSLLAFAGVVFGTAPYIVFLPVVAGAIDWLVMGSSWERTRRPSGILRVMRVSLVLLSALVALYASLLGERDNLLQQLRAHEREEALRDPEIAHRATLFGAEIRTLQAQVVENQRLLLQERPALVAKYVTAVRLAEKEARGETGYDTETQTYIRGGGICGPRCQNHKSDARAIQHRIDELDRLPEANAALQQRITEVERARDGLIAARAGDTESMGSLFRAATHADVGTIVQLVAKIFALVVLELAALGLATLKPSDNLLLAKRLEREEDELSMRNHSKFRRAAIMDAHDRARGNAGASQVPVTVALEAPVRRVACRKVAAGK